MHKQAADSSPASSRRRGRTQRLHGYRSQLTATPSAYLRMGMRARAMHEIRVIGAIR